MRQRLLLLALTGVAGLAAGISFDNRARGDLIPSLTLPTVTTFRRCRRYRPRPRCRPRLRCLRHRHCPRFRHRRRFLRRLRCRPAHRHRR